MNIALRKLAMLEKSFQEKEEYSKIEGVSCTFDRDLQNRITKLMDKVRYL